MERPISRENTHKKRAKTLISHGLQQAKSLARSTSPSVRLPPGANDRHEKSRLRLEAKTDLLELVGRWKDHGDKLEPSSAWKRTHPRMNYHLQATIKGLRSRNWRSDPSAQRDFEEARERYLEAGCPREEMYWSNPHWQGDHLERLARQYSDCTRRGGSLDNAFA